MMWATILYLTKKVPPATSGAKLTSNSQVELLNTEVCSFFFFFFPPSFFFFFLKLYARQ